MVPYAVVLQVPFGVAEPLYYAIETGMRPKSVDGERIEWRRRGCNYTGIIVHLNYPFAV